MVIALDQLLSSEEIVYVADPLHFPYGEKAKNKNRFILFLHWFHLNAILKAKLIITACGTISSNLPGGTGHFCFKFQLLVL